MEKATAKCSGSVPEVDSPCSSLLPQGDTWVCVVGVYVGGVWESMLFIIMKRRSFGEVGSNWRTRSSRLFSATHH